MLTYGPWLMRKIEMAHPSIYQMYPLAKPPFLIAREGGGEVIWLVGFGCLFGFMSENGYWVNFAQVFHSKR